MLVIVQYKILLILRQRASEAPEREEQAWWRRPIILAGRRHHASLPGTNLCCQPFGGKMAGREVALSVLRGSPVVLNFTQSRFSRPVSLS